MALLSITCCETCKPPIRHLYCHDTCPEYLTQKKAMEKQQQEIRQKKQRENNVRDYQRSRGKSIYNEYRKKYPHKY